MGKVIKLVLLWIKKMGQSREAVAILTGRMTLEFSW